MNFEQALEHVFRLEGGYVNDPSDAGGETKFGISKAAHPDVDIANLTKPQAASIYRAHYWTSAGCDYLPGILRLPVFAAAVHAGPKQAIVLLQRTLGVKEDGVLGPKTLRASNMVRSPELLEDLLEEYLSECCMYYATRKQVLIFGRGWFRRVIRVARAG